MPVETIVDLKRERRRRESQRVQCLHVKTEAALVDAFRAGNPIIHGCCFGFMLDGQEIRKTAHFSVSTNPGPIRGDAEAEHVRAVLQAWSKRLDEYDAPTKKPAPE